jgi:hypothetical protein
MSERTRKRDKDGDLLQVDKTRKRAKLIHTLQTG